MTKKKPKQDVPIAILPTMTPQMLDEARRKVRVARNALMLKFPFFGPIAFGVNYEMVDPGDEFITTAATDGETIFWHPAFMLALSDQDRQFVQAHEIMHIVTWSMKRLGSRDPRIWNAATDYAINSAIVRSGMKMPSLPVWRNGKTEDVIIGLHNDDFDGKLPEEIYELLIQDGGKKYEIGSIDQHVDGKITKKNGKTVVVKRSPLAGDALDRKIKGMVAGALMDPNAPSILKRIMQDIGEPKINWRDILAARILAVKSGDYEWVPPDSAFFWQGITIPSITDETSLKVALVIDVSGSVSEKELNSVFTEILSLASQFNTWEALVVSFDHTVHNPRVYTEVAELKRHETEGGGGTSFESFFRYLRGIDTCKGERCEFKPDIVVVFTDGGTADGWGLSHKDEFDLLWILTSDVVPPWGQYVRFDPYV